MIGEPLLLAESIFILAERHGQPIFAKNKQMGYIEQCELLWQKLKPVQEKHESFFKGKTPPLNDIQEYVRIGAAITGRPTVEVEICDLIPRGELRDDINKAINDAFPLR